MSAQSELLGVVQTSADRALTELEGQWLPDRGGRIPLFGRTVIDVMARAVAAEVVRDLLTRQEAREQLARVSGMVSAQEAMDSHAGNIIQAVRDARRTGHPEGG